MDLNLQKCKFLRHVLKKSGNGLHSHQYPMDVLVLGNGGWGGGRAETLRQHTAPLTFPVLVGFTTHSDRNNSRGKCRAKCHRGS